MARRPKMQGAAPPAPPIQHVGFQGAVNNVMASEGVKKANAERIIGAAKAGASAAARRRNPRLNRTAGGNY